MSALLSLSREATEILCLLVTGNKAQGGQSEYFLRWYFSGWSLRNSAGDWVRHLNRDACRDLAVHGLIESITLGPFCQYFFLSQRGKTWGLILTAPVYGEPEQARA